MVWQSNPKPGPWKKVKAHRKRVADVARRGCRARVFDRDGGCCTSCGRALVLLLKNCTHEFQLAHIHEIKPRSLGGDPHDDTNCLTLCYQCHPQAHRLRVG